MKGRIWRLAALLLALAFFQREPILRPAHAQIIDSEHHDPEVAKARVEAKRAMPRFERLFRTSDAESFSVQVAFPTRRGRENIWMRLDSIDGDLFTGVIANEPRDIVDLRRGDRHAASRNRILDWIYVKDGITYGGFTVRVLARRQPDGGVAILSGYSKTP